MSRFRPVEVSTRRTCRAGQGRAGKKWGRDGLKANPYFSSVRSCLPLTSKTAFSIIILMMIIIIIIIKLQFFTAYYLLAFSNVNCIRIRVHGKVIEKRFFAGRKHRLQLF